MFNTKPTGTASVIVKSSTTNKSSCSTNIFQHVPEKNDYTFTKNSHLRISCRCCCQLHKMISSTTSSYIVFQEAGEKKQENNYKGNEGWWSRSAGYYKSYCSSQIVMDLQITKQEINEKGHTYKLSATGLDADIHAESFFLIKL